MHRNLNWANTVDKFRMHPFRITSDYNTWVGLTVFAISPNKMGTILPHEEYKALSKLLLQRIMHGIPNLISLVIHYDCSRN